MGELENDGYVIPAFLLKIPPDSKEVDSGYQEAGKSWIQSDYPEDKASALKGGWDVFKLRLMRILLK